MKQSTKSVISEYLQKTSSVILTGIVLLFAVTLIAGNIDRRMTGQLMDNTFDTLKNQCTNYNKIVTADRTKSLFRLSDSLIEMRKYTENMPLSEMEETVDDYVESMRLSGVFVLDGDLNILISSFDGGYTHIASDAYSLFSGELQRDRLKKTAAAENSVYAQRLTSDGRTIDVSVISRADAGGVIIGFYEQPEGQLEDSEDDLVSLLCSMHMERGGSFVIVSGGRVLATDDGTLRGAEKSNVEILGALDRLPHGADIMSVSSDGSLYLGGRQMAETYDIYVYFPAFLAYKNTMIASGMFMLLYIALRLLFVVVKARSLREKQAELVESNTQLQRTVNMLHSLENIYFSVFYVDTKTDRYSSVFLAPWLEGLIPESGAYTEMRDILMDILVSCEDRERLAASITLDSIRERLRAETLTDLRQSFYADFRASRYGAGEEMNWCRITVIAVDFDGSGMPLHVMAVLQDVNAEKAKEADYQKRKIEEAQEARSANNAKTEFLRRISHDIRTPINGIQGLIKMADSFHDDEEKQQIYRAKMSSALSYLLDLVNNVLDMSKLESGEIVPEDKSFDLAEVLRQANTPPEAQAAENGVEYSWAENCDIPVTHLVGSPLYLRQILLNICENAVKYTGRGGRVSMSCRPVSESGDGIVYEFSCADTGIGMGEEFKEHMFDPFAQENIDARSRYQGSGLGLAIVKKLTDAMGGSIDVDSKKGKGTTFRVRLPFAKDLSDAREADARGEIIPEEHALNVLVAEDNELNMEITEFLLKRHGMTVTKAADGAEALDIFTRSRVGEFDLILMDIMMPHMDGNAAASAIRALDRPDARTVPIIAMSANSFGDDIKESLRAGMNAHVPKPIDERTLIGTVRRLTGQDT